MNEPEDNLPKPRMAASEFAEDLARRIEKEQRAVLRSREDDLDAERFQ